MESKHRPTTNRVAFIGSPGIGKTTSLCKILAHSSFFENYEAHVFKLDQEIPNPDDALRIFANPLVSTSTEIALYWIHYQQTNFSMDTPGIPLSDTTGWSQLGRELDDLNINTRVLVLNSVYDTGVLKSTLDAAMPCRPTHLIFTHLDELQNSAKLWPFVFSKELSTLMLCHGQNITSDYTRDNLCNYLLASSFLVRYFNPLDLTFFNFANERRRFCLPHRSLSWFSIGFFPGLFASKPILGLGLERLMWMHFTLIGC